MSDERTQFRAKASSPPSKTCVAHAKGRPEPSEEKNSSFKQGPEAVPIRKPQSPSLSAKCIRSNKDRSKRVTEDISSGLDSKMTDGFPILNPTLMQERQVATSTSLPLSDVPPPPLPVPKAQYKDEIPRPTVTVPSLAPSNLPPPQPVIARTQRRDLTSKSTTPKPFRSTVSLSPPLVPNLERRNVVESASGRSRIAPLTSPRPSSAASPLPPSVWRTKYSDEILRPVACNLPLSPLPPSKAQKQCENIAKTVSAKLSSTESIPPPLLSAPPPPSQVLKIQCGDIVKTVPVRPKPASCVTATAASALPPSAWSIRCEVTTGTAPVSLTSATPFPPPPKYKVPRKQSGGVTGTVSERPKRAASIPYATSPSSPSVPRIQFEGPMRTTLERSRSTTSIKPPTNSPPRPLIPGSQDKDATETAPVRPKSTISISYPPTTISSWSSVLETRCGDRIGTTHTSSKAAKEPTSSPPLPAIGPGSPAPPPRIPRISIKGAKIRIGKSKGGRMRVATAKLSQPNTAKIGARKTGAGKIRARVLGSSPQNAPVPVVSLLL